MNRPRDIERTLEGFFLDGPSVMPDRVFEAVFDQVERTPQRRLARLHLRLTEMNPSIRWLTFAAAALVVVVVGLAAFSGRNQTNNVGASPSPSTASTPDPAVPTALRGRWNGGTRAMPGIQPESGTSILLDGSSVELSHANNVDVPQLRSLVRAVGQNQLEFQSADDRQRCPVADTGRYTWALSPGGKTLTLTAEAEACADRQAGLAGTWWLEDCPIADDGCYGELEGGTYSSQYFDPFVPEGGTWRPRFGALVFTAPAGWSNSADWPLSFNIEAPGGVGLGTGIFLYSDVVAAAEDDPCGETKATGVGETAEEIATWLGSIPGIAATAPSQQQIGGLDAWRVDISLDPGWTTTCEFSEGEPYHGLFVDRPDASGFAWGLRGSGRMRLYLADLGDGRALLINIEGATKAAYDAFVDDATTIVESFQITR